MDKLDINLKEAFISDYNTIGGSTTIILATDGSNLVDIGTIDGGYEVVSFIAANSEFHFEGEVFDMPNQFSLKSAYPNPFNPSTNIGLIVAQSGHVSVKVYNIVGQQVDVLVDKFMESSSSEYNISWNAEGLPSGAYLISAQQGDNIATQKVMLLK